MKNTIHTLICAAVCTALLTSCANTAAPDTGVTSLTESLTAVTVSEETTSAAPVPDVQEEPLPTAVTFSRPTGVYGEEFELALSAEEGEIFYTTDGSDPTSDKGQAYTAPIAVADRRGDKNVIAAVDPTLIAASFCERNEDKTAFVSTLSAPEDTQVDKCTLIRAAVRYPNGTYSAESTGVYFIGTAEEHIRGLSESCAAAGEDLAVISLGIDYDDLFDEERGIYVKGNTYAKAFEEYIKEKGHARDPEDGRALPANYKQRGREWERPAVMELMEFSGDGTARTVLSQQCGVRIQGNYSRSDVQKGLRLYARSSYGKKSFEYPIFGEDYVNDVGQVMDRFDTFILRAGGNCAFTAKFNDTYWQTLCRDTECETKRSRPCVVYVNGEYMGLYVLEEDYTDDHFEDLHGVKKEDVVVYKGDAEAYATGYKLDEGDVPPGEDESYYFRELYSFFRTHRDCRSQENYSALCALVDPESVRDYFAVECWINNKWDWPGKNWSMWRTTSEEPGNKYADTRWRFMFYDMEFGGVSGKGDIQTNTVKEDNYKRLGLLDTDTGNPAVLCFAYMMTNEGFRKDFEDTLTGLSEGIFEKQRALAALDEFEAVYAPLYEQFFDRYPGTGDAEGALYGGYASSQCIRDFVTERAEHIYKQIEFIEETLSDE